MKMQPLNSRSIAKGLSKVTVTPKVPVSCVVLITLISLATLSACAPKIYVIERTTVLEEEAAGSWPELETRWKKANVKTAPRAVKTEEASEKQRRLTRALEPDSLTVNPTTSK